MHLTNLKVMATYNKRGYKTPKEKEEKVDGNAFVEETVDVNEADSTTAGVFSKLDEGASKTEEWVERNQKYIFGILAAVALITVGYLLYNKYVAEPKQDTAANEMFDAQQFFKQATEATTPTASDSLFKLALNGQDKKLGFLNIAADFSGTDAGNLSNYYAGMALLNTGKFAEAIKYLEDFSSNDKMLKPLAIGAIGDANSELNKPKEALEFYIKASETNKNELTTPRFLLKAGLTALSLDMKADALKYFTEIKEKYETSPDAQAIDGYIAMVK